MKDSDYNQNMKLNKYSFINPFSTLILILVFFAVFSLVKHQEIASMHQFVLIEVVGKDWTNNFNQFEGYRPPNWLADNLNIGAEEKSSDGRVVAKILDIDYFESTGGNAQLFLTIDAEVVSLFSIDGYVFKGQNLAVGEEISFNFENSKVVGQVIGVSSENNFSNPTTARVSGKFRGVPISVINQINNNLKVSNPFTNEVYVSLETYSLSPSTQATLLKDSRNGRLVFQTDYQTMDVNAVFLVKAEEKMGRLYYSGHQAIKVGEKVRFFFPELELGQMEIDDVEIVDQTINN